MPDEARPGPPPTLWAASTADPSAPWSPGLACWHPHWKVWVHLLPGEPLATGERAPVDGVPMTLDPGAAS